MSCWPFPVFRYKPADSELSELFRAFARSDELQVLEPIYGKTQLECRLGRLSFDGVSSGAFSLGNAGTYTSTTGHVREWKDFMPDRGAVRETLRAIRVATSLRGVTKRTGDSDTPIRDIEPRLTLIFEAFARADDLRVVWTRDNEAMLHCELGWLRFWNANKFAVWADRGTFRQAGGDDYSWSMKQPSLDAMRAVDAAMQTAVVLRGVGEPPKRAAPASSVASVASEATARVAQVQCVAKIEPRFDATLRDLHAGFAMAGILASIRDKADIAAVRPEAFYAWADEAAKARQPGFALVPLEPDEAMLRPFHTCPPEELPQAYSAMLMVAERRRAEPAIDASRR